MYSRDEHSAELSRASALPPTSPFRWILGSMVRVDGEKGNPSSQQLYIGGLASQLSIVSVLTIFCRMHPAPEPPDSDFRNTFSRAREK